jgi:hypothetical protein
MSFSLDLINKRQFSNWFSFNYDGVFTAKCNLDSILGDDKLLAKIERGLFTGVPLISLVRGSLYINEVPGDRARCVNTDDVSF